MESPRQLGYRVRVNNDYHQTALDLSADAADVPFVRNWRDRYDAPYTLVKPGRVLVLGAGSGNDVQALPGSFVWKPGEGQVLSGFNNESQKCNGAETA